ncbi:hypothetical protein [Synechococcus sp. CCY 0621]|nr:hypothetical protein [Synechococcus sp. CCY 0621]
MISRAPMASAQAAILDGHRRADGSAVPLLGALGPGAFGSNDLV